MYILELVMRYLDRSGLPVLERHHNVFLFHLLLASLALLEYLRSITVTQVFVKHIHACHLVRLVLNLRDLNMPIFVLLKWPKDGNILT